MEHSECAPEETEELVTHRKHPRSLKAGQKAQESRKAIFFSSLTSHSMYFGNLMKDAEVLLPHIHVARPFYKTD